MTDSPNVTATFEAIVTDDGKLVFDEPGIVIARLMRMFRGKQVEVRVERQKQRRTDAQNRYYWVACVPVMAEATGYETEEAHDIMKCMFLRKELVLPSGEVVERVRSTTELTIPEFAEYVNKCCRWLSSQGWYVPQPGEQVVA